MHERAALLAGSLVTPDETLDREFERRLVESSTLAYRVAFSVIRHQHDAEDIAQEAMVKAYRNFRRLRDRERFRAWLVRTAWQTALDRQRANRRRAVREVAVEAPPTAPVGPSVSRDHLASDRSADLWAAIDALPEKLRVVIGDGRCDWCCSVDWLARARHVFVTTRSPVRAAFITAGTCYRQRARGHFQHRAARNLTFPSAVANGVAGRGDGAEQQFSNSHRVCRRCTWSRRSDSCGASGEHPRHAAHGHRVRKRRAQGSGY